MPTDDQIEQAAREFRAAVDAAGPEPWKQKWITFPRGACGHIAELLALHLRQKLGITTTYVGQDASKPIGGWTGAHSWLEWNGLTIDISGDQFGWEPVIVTRNPVYHGRGSTHSNHATLLDMGWFARECGSIWTAIPPHLS